MLSPVKPVKFTFWYLANDSIFHSKNSLLTSTLVSNLFFSSEIFHTGDDPSGGWTSAGEKPSAVVDINIEISSHNSVGNL